MSTRGIEFNHCSDITIGRQFEFNAGFGGGLAGSEHFG